MPLDPATGTETTLPRRLRQFFRTSELALVALAALVGAGAGLVVIAMNGAMQALHVLIFRIPDDAHLSVWTSVPAVLLLLGPVLGGLIFGAVSRRLTRRGASAPIDPIEANALHGGRMSLGDSGVVAAQTLVSSGVGASVGLEAGYTQAAAGLASALGQKLHLRRADLRLLVACGAGAAIGAAFDAPLMGAFYGFELILGTYAIPAFVPMMTATFTASLTRHLLQPVSHPSLPLLDVPPVEQLPAVILLGCLAALLGIAVMRGVTLVEAGFRRSGLPGWLRPALAGAIIGAMALWNPAVLSAGHGAVYHYIAADGALLTFALLLAAKLTASAVSIGSGFRGGLFFASLLMGVFAGRLYAAGLDLLLPGIDGSHAFYALIGMGALAVAVVGGPMTMTLLALEMTGDLRLTLAVLAACGAASLVTRRLFGFSFATWRFHLRGENIRGAHDVGWLHDLTVESLMRREVPQLGTTTSLTEARHLYPPGSTGDIVVVDAQGRYAGLVAPALLYQSDDTVPLRSLLRHTGESLRPDMTIRDALTLFETTETEALAVIDVDGQVIGLLSERDAIRRYSDEMRRRLSELTGDRES